ncbi:hypothetical protein CASFOL_003303 [Castilleja foliolosa]|uniref:Uncharacterized protein n=1 Tax=Castilleja foliolosa TaxID=1961234 RepID=A0ABD3EHB1_9LAMI
MSAVAKTDRSTVEKEYQAFKDELDLLEQVRACNLWTPAELDFRKVCCCDDCLPKIERLNQFEKEMKAKRNLISAYLVQMDRKENLCISIANCAGWNKRTLEFFQKKLKAVSEKSGVPWTPIKCISTAEDIDKEITHMLRKCGILPQLNDDDDDDDDDDSAIVDDDDDDDDDDVLGSIDYALFYYKKTKSNNNAYAILQEMEKLEKDRQMEEQNKNLDPAFSKNYIEKQIEELKKLSVEDLRNEVKKVIAEIRPKDHRKLFEEARQSMYDACYAIIGKRMEFWQKSPSVANEGNEHISNGLEETLNSLLDEVNSFEKKWEDNYAQFYTPGDQSDPKRQRTE